MSNWFLIVQREYLERVRKKSFIITTILMPVLMIVLMAAPALIMNYTTPDKNTLAVVDPTGLIANDIQSNEFTQFVAIDENPDSAVSHGTINGYIVIPEDVMTSRRPVINLMVDGTIPVELHSYVSGQVSKSIENHKLLSYNIEDLPSILEAVQTDVKINEVRIDKEEGESFSSSVSTLIGIFMAFILYMFILMYGQMVMTSIIEEKNNRVLELVVSSVKPTQLMMGKISGIGLVAVTQILIWGVCIGLISSVALPAFMSAESLGQIDQLRAGTLDASSVDNLGMLNAMSMFMNGWFIAKLFAWLILFLIGGFLLYSSMFAATGSAVENIQDASQLQSFILIPIILALIVSTSVGNAPNSALAMWTSMIPFTSPMVMMSRVPLGIPEWQIWVSLVILYASFAFMVWFSGKIYRIGIFMYGKKPNVKELIRWARYK